MSITINSPDTAEISQSEEIRRLRKINQALMDQVERSMDQQGSAFSIFQTAINLEGQIKRRTQELSSTLAHLERSNHELKTAKENAERLNLSKTQFLAAASHDVLQPLNAATLLVSSLNAIQTSDEGERLCNQVDRSLQTMSNLLRSLLYITRLDAGDIQPEWQSVSIKQLFESIVSDFEPVISRKNLEFRFTHNDLYVHSDPTMLRRILQNIVTNAIHYTNEGGVALIAGKHQDRVRIRIADTGIGIEKHQYDNIFQEFHRCNRIAQTHDQPSGGLGLGLAIVARMVRTLNHSLTLNSCVDRGSCFQLTMLGAEPSTHVVNAAQQRNTTEVSKNTGLQDINVLLIENDLDVLKAMELLLIQWGCKLRMATSTNEALNIVADAWQPDLIVADQHLDADDLGTTTIRHLHTLTGVNIPAVIITANPSKSLTRKAEASGIEVLLKPVKPAQLRALLTHLVSG